MKAELEIQPCECGSPNARWWGPRDGLREYKCCDCRLAETTECVRLLHGVVAEVLPQIGGIVLQDYARLNNALILAEKLMGGDK